MRVPSILLSIALLAPLSAQSVTVTAMTSGTGIQVNAYTNPSNVPAGIDVSGGYDYTDSGVQSARAYFSLDHAELASNAICRTETQSAGLSPISAGADVTLHYASPVPMLVDVAVAIYEVRLASSPYLGGIATGSCSVEVVGHGTLTNLSCAAPCAITFYDVPLDASGLDVRLRSDAWSSGGFRFPRPMAVFECRSRVWPSRCTAVYGAQCSATMTVFPSLSEIGVQRLTVSDSTPLPFGVLLLGTQRLQFPMPWGCTLYTDAILALPLALDTNGSTTLRFRPPATLFTLQAATFGSTSIHMSEGIEFDCR